MGYWGACRLAPVRAAREGDNALTSNFADFDSQKTPLVYRPFTKADFAAAARLYQAQWCSEISDKAGQIASQVDLCAYLAQANWSLVAEKPQVNVGTPQLLGVALLSIKTQTCPHAATWLSQREELLAKAAADATLLAEVRSDVDMLEEEAQLGNEYAASGQVGSAAELKLLIVSPAAQGLGVGGRLFSAARQAAHDAADGMFLLTDDSCDFSFYEHKGLTRMVTRPTLVDQLACPQDAAGFNLYVYAEGDAR